MASSCLTRDRVGPFARVRHGAAGCRAAAATLEVIVDQVFFTGWDGVRRTLIIGLLAYPALILFLRIAGNRTLAKLNAFDLIVTVALGSTLATVLLSKTVALAEGVLAFFILVGLQFLVTWSSVRVRWVRRVVTGEPRLLLYQGEMLLTALRKARLTQDEVMAAVRGAGVHALENVQAVVLETDGSLSVVGRGAATSSSLQNVRASTSRYS
jgi:uncharacterized membrane protein YcaP (DUF421 family)